MKMLTGRCGEVSIVPSVSLEVFASKFYLKPEWDFAIGNTV